MLSRRLLPLLLATVTLASAVDLVPAGEPQWSQLLPRAQRVLIATAEQSADLREAGSVTVAVDRALRGRGRKGETIVVGHDGSLATAQFEKGRQYLFLLQPGLDDARNWTYVGTSALPYEGEGVAIPESGDMPAVTVALSDLQGFVDQFPSSPEAMLTSRTSLNGRWAAVTSIHGRDIPLWVLEVRDEEGMASAEIVGIDSQFKSAQLDSFDVTDGMVNFRILTQSAEDLSNHAFQFEGRLQDGVVVGNCVADKNVIRACKLRPTSAKTIAQTGGVKATLGLQEFDKAFVAEDEFAAYQQFVESHPQSPLAIEAYLKMLRSDTAKGLDEQEINALAQAHIANSAQWGETMRRQAVVEAGVEIAQDENFPELALKYLNEAEPFVTDTSPQPWSMMVPFHTARMVWKTGDHDEASRRMNAYHKIHPFEPIGAFYAASMLEERGKFDEALQIYSELATLPKMKEFLEQSMAGNPDYSPVEKSMLALWQKHRAKSGGQDEFILHMIDSYRAAVHNFATDKVEPRPSKPGVQNHVVLMELFTNAEPTVVVGIDVALSGLTHVMAPSELIVLRYHLATADPDSMAGPECDARLAYYDSRILPTLCIDGKSEQMEAGEVIHAQSFYQDIRKMVEPILAETVDVELKLSAKVDGDNLVISAEALRAAAFEEQLRLRLVLVEEEVVVEAANGLMMHENLVRIMPGGVAGIAPQDGKLKFDTTISIEDYRQQLNDGLTAYEEDRSNVTGKDFKYDFRPIGPRKLKLVAFVQNDTTKEVLQSAIVDVQNPQANAAPKAATDPQSAKEPERKADADAPATE